MDETRPPMRLVEHEETDGRWALEKLSDWIARHPAEPPDEDLRDWLEAHGALQRSEIDIDGEVEEFVVLDGAGAVYFGYSMVATPEGPQYRHTLRRYHLADEPNGGE